MKKAAALLLLVLMTLAMSACDSDTSSSSYSYSGSRGMTAQEKYDAKYGKGAFEADRALMDEMRSAYNSMIGR